MPNFWSDATRRLKTAVGKAEPATPPGRERSKTPAGIAEQLGSLYVSIRGAPYANSLNEAKAAFQANKYAEALRLVQGASDIYRRSHLPWLQQDPGQASGKNEAQALRDKQTKIKGIVEVFDTILERLERLAKLKQDPQATSVRPGPVAKPASAPALSGAKPAAHPAVAVDRPAETVASTIDTGTFTQLQTVAQQTGLLANADAIGFVREHEFRVGKYHEAFDRIEAIYLQLRTAADQRLQRLRREDLEHKSGVLKMSPKDWALKVQRDTAQTQVIDRAIRYFLRVLDGLRILVGASKG